MLTVGQIERVLRMDLWFYHVETIVDLIKKNFFGVVGMKVYFKCVSERLGGETLSLDISFKESYSKGEKRRNGAVAEMEMRIWGSFL